MIAIYRRKNGIKAVQVTISLFYLLKCLYFPTFYPNNSNEPVVQFFPFEVVTYTGNQGNMQYISQIAVFCFKLSLSLKKGSKKTFVAI